MSLSSLPPALSTECSAFEPVTPSPTSNSPPQLCRATPTPRASALCPKGHHSMCPPAAPSPRGGLIIFSLFHIPSSVLHSSSSSLAVNPCSGSVAKKYFSLFDLDKHVSANANPIPSWIICCVYSSMLPGKAKEAFLPLYEQPLGRSSIKLSLSQAGGMRKRSRCFEPGGC